MPLKIGIHRPPAQSHAHRWLNAFASGVKRHGETLIYGSSAPLPVDLSVFWSAKKHDVIAHQEKNGADYLVLEHGYFGDRINTFCSAGFNGLNGRADFLLPISKPADRWEKHGVEVRPWRVTDGDYVLIIGQVAGDAAVQTMPRNWYARMAEEAGAIFRKPVKFRPHPLSRQAAEIDGAETIAGDLQDAFEKAHCVVTFSSNAGVDAALAGVPVFVMDAGGMAWPVAAHRLRRNLARPDRTLWLRHLAYCQWTESEYASGEAWEFLRTKYET